MFFYRLKMAIVFTCVVILALILIGTFSGNWSLLTSFGESLPFQFGVLFACWLAAPFFYRFFDDG